MSIFRKREPTTNAKEGNVNKDVFQMVTTYGEHYYSWNGKLYQSDIVRACIRPKVKAIGKLIGKHIRVDPNKGLQVNPEANIKFLLEEPNPHMTGQQMQEKVANQLCLNNNAFILIVRDENGRPMQLYPIPCVTVETKYNKQGELFLRFQYMNGKSGIFKYTDIIHLRQDYNDSDIFGESPAPALRTMMELVGTMDQGVVKAIKNSGVVRWLLQFTQSMRPEDIKSYVDAFVKNYLSVESETFGAAGVDTKATATRVEPKDYVPNAAQTDRVIDRIYSFFNTNKKIVQSSYSEDEWIAYYESEIEPVVNQMHQCYTIKIFTRKERGFRNEIVFEANNLHFASMQTKLGLLGAVDRGAMSPNEWRDIMYMAPAEGGDVMIRRLDTQVVNLIETAMSNMDKDNFETMGNIVIKMLDCVKGGESGNGTQDRCSRGPDTE